MIHRMDYRALDAFRELLQRSVKRPHPFPDESARMAPMSDDAVKKLWDAYDGCNSPQGICGEAIHLELNLRGHGEYCAV